MGEEVFPVRTGGEDFCRMIPSKTGLLETAKHMGWRCEFQTPLFCLIP